MKSTIENDTLVLALEGRIDTANAAAVEKEIADALSAHSTLTPAFDADSLTYISSAGLRVLMKIAKQAEKKLVIRNVSKDVYDIFDTTGFTNILTAQKKLRHIDVAGCELLGQGGNGSVYRLDDDKIVKVYKPWMTREAIDRERNFARTAFMNGVPSVIAYDLVRVGESYGIVFEMIKSKTLGATIKENPGEMEAYVDKYVALAKQLHSIHVASGTFTNIKTVLHGRVPKLARWCSKEELTLLDSLIDAIPDCDTIIHNDLHPGNIMIQDGELVLIDMPEVTTGPALYDLTAIFRDMIVATSGEAAEHLEHSVGLPKEMCVQVADMFFTRYLGFTDRAQLEGYYKMLQLPNALNVCLVIGTESERAMQLAPIILDKLLRGVIIPNEETLRKILASAQ